MVDSKENYKFVLGVKGLRPVSCGHNHYLKSVFLKVVQMYLAHFSVWESSLQLKSYSLLQLDIRHHQFSTCHCVSCVNKILS